MPISASHGKKRRLGWGVGCDNCDESRLWQSSRGGAEVERGASIRDSVTARESPKLPSTLLVVRWLFLITLAEGALLTLGNSRRISASSTLRLHNVSGSITVADLGGE